MSDISKEIENDSWFTKDEIAYILKTNQGINYTPSQIKHMKKSELLSQLGKCVTESKSIKKTQKKSSFKQILKKMFRRPGY